MSDPLTMEQFVAMTRNVASDDEEFLPTFVDPEARDIRALDGIPASKDVAQVARDWAAGFGATHYFIAYANRHMIVAEEYKDGALAAAQDIQLN